MVAMEIPEAGTRSNRTHNYINLSWILTDAQQIEARWVAGISV